MPLVAFYLLALAFLAVAFFRAWHRYTRAGRRLEQLRRFRALAR